jgi:hypothetical protein
MKNGNLTILYTKKTRKVYATCSVATEQTEQTEQQSSRALCRSRDIPLRLSVIAYRNLLPEAL